MKLYVTDFGEQRFAPALAQCMDNYTVGDDESEWPNNVLSRQTVVYDSGVIARRGTSVVHRVDPDELALCQRLAGSAAEIMQGVSVGMKSEADDPFHPFFQVGNVSDNDTPGVAPAVVDSALVRRLFGGTICPADAIYVEPLREGGFFWAEIGHDADDDDEESENVLDAWRRLIRFFTESKDLVHPSFACIGFGEYSPPKADSTAVDSESIPGFEMHGSCLPRLPFAFTKAGSLVGLFGHVVWT